MTNRSSGCDQLLVDARRGDQQVAVLRGTADAAAGARHPVPGVERAQLLHEQLARLLVRHRTSSLPSGQGRGDGLPDTAPGARRASVMKPVMSAAGVTSKAGFQTARVRGAVTATPPKPRTSAAVALLDDDVVAVGGRASNVVSGPAT